MDEPGTAESGTAESGTAESGTAESGTAKHGDQPLYVYMDSIWVNRRADEWVASCMVHSDEGTEDVTVEASHGNREGARDKLRRALLTMGVPAPEGE